MSELKIGMGFCGTKGAHLDQYGVILEIGDDYVAFCEVKSVYNSFGFYTPCYDDANASERHKDNVRLCDCPPPFSKLCEKGDDCMKRGAYAIADLNNAKIMSRDEFSKNAMIIDDGKLVSDRDMHNIHDHQRSDQRELEKLRRTYAPEPSFDDIDFDDTNDNFDRDPTDD